MNVCFNDDFPCCPLNSMSCNISKIFFNTVRALKTSDSGSDSRKSSFSPLASSKCGKPVRANAPDVFSTRARGLAGELQVVRDHLSKARVLGVAVASQDAVRQRLYHELAKQIVDALDQCSQLLSQLRQYSLLTTAGGSDADEVSKRPQLQEHQRTVCKLLEESLNALKRERDDQVATYCRRVELTGRLSGAVTKHSGFGSLTSSSSTLRHRGQNWLSTEPSVSPVEAVDVKDLSTNELQALETENAEMYLRLVSEQSEVQQLGTSLSEIGRLQSIITESLVEQAEKAERIGEQIVGSSELIREANEKLREAMDRTKGVRFWILFFMLVLTFSLHFLDWYRDAYPRLLITTASINIAENMRPKRVSNGTQPCFTRLVVTVAPGVAFEKSPPTRIHRPKSHTHLTQFPSYTGILTTAQQRHEVVVTGIQPTGIPHLGNYLGMIKPVVKLQSSDSISRIIILIADLHALTCHQPASQLNTAIMHLAAALLSCGLDPMESVAPSETKKTILFLQSCRLAHLPQWREKSAAAAAVPSHATSEPSTATAAGFSNTGNPTASVGLFTYPILQAADILLYDADAVPVGVDQIGHLELTRDLARSVAARWPDLAQHVRVPRILLNERIIGGDAAGRLPVDSPHPSAVPGVLTPCWLAVMLDPIRFEFTTEVPYFEVNAEDKTNEVLNLRDPSKKMSKSQGPEAGTIWLTDTPDIIRHKVGRAQTDSLRGVSYDPVARPGIANLIQLYSALKDLSIQSATEELSRLSKVDLKLKITDELVRELSPIQERFNELTSSLTANPDSYLYTVLSVGSSVAQHMASKKLRIFFEALGLPRHFLTQQAVKR
ncbi:unnamed protein product [Schistocephalus solidus]|uniref:tryptophan--tRNA ligase n=1 Tax=Schistocephalus solidus TaxID=70667 RepID=A0A183SGR0_SCHSO|nr:unnamed protein product [Schistocephalus solidus]